MTPLWEDPPPKVRGKGPAPSPLRAEMRAHPGRWLVWHEASRSPSGGARLVRDGFEVTRRRNKDRTYRIYARWPEEAS